MGTITNKPINRRAVKPMDDDAKVFNPISENKIEKKSENGLKKINKCFIVEVKSFQIFPSMPNRNNQNITLEFFWTKNLSKPFKPQKVVIPDFERYNGYINAQDNTNSGKVELNLECLFDSNDNIMKINDEVTFEANITFNNKEQKTLKRTDISRFLLSPDKTNFGFHLIQTVEKEFRTIYIYIDVKKSDEREDKIKITKKNIITEYDAVIGIDDFSEGFQEGWEVKIGEKISEELKKEKIFKAFIGKKD